MPSKTGGEQSSTPLPTPTITRSDVIVTPVPENKQDSFLEYVKNRRTLSESDASTKKQILALLPPEEDSGVLYQTPTISIEYVHEPDLFQVEILTEDIPAAKNEATTWFKAKGMSQEGICLLPVQFYLNYDVANELKKTNITFNPLSDGC